MAPSTATRRKSAPKAASDKQDAILAAALELFVSRGFHGTAVPAVAKKAGVAAGTIYHYFDGKETLVNVLFRRWKGVIAQRIFTDFPAGAPPREQFRAIWTSMAAFARDNPHAFAFLEYHHHGSYLDDESRAVDSALKKFGETFVVAAQNAGVLKPIEPVVLMELVFGAFNGMMRAEFEGRIGAGKITLNTELIAAAEAACWDLVRVTES